MHTHPHSRRNFLTTLFGSSLGSASLLEISIARAAFARGQAATATQKLFDIEKITPGVYIALAHPMVVGNCNAVIFENADSLLIVDTHSYPSAVASLVAQIRKEITRKPVRYVVNTHFHGDHVQGNPGYVKEFPKADIVASDATKQLMGQLAEKRIRAGLEKVPASIAQAEEKASKAKTAEARAYYADEARQWKSYLAEMHDYHVALPSVTFADSYLIKDKAGDMHLSFHGRAHTSSDVIVFSPSKKIIAAGDLIHGSFPTISDGYPREWPATLDAVSKLDFQYVAPGHGPVHHGKGRIHDMRNYLEELTARVAEGKAAGKSVAELQKSITQNTLKSFNSDGYAEYVLANRSKYYRHLGPVKFQDGLDANIAQVYTNLDGAHPS